MTNLLSGDRESWMDLPSSTQLEFQCVTFVVFVSGCMGEDGFYLVWYLPCVVLLQAVTLGYARVCATTLAPIACRNTWPRPNKLSFINLTWWHLEFNKRPTARGKREAKSKLFVLNGREQNRTLSAVLHTLLLNGWSIMNFLFTF